jgi:hypothetical protein
MSKNVKTIDVETYFKTLQEEIITPIRGCPTPAQLITHINNLSRTVANVDNDYSAYGMMYLVLPPDLYTTPWHGRDSKKLNFQVRV